MEEYEFEFVTVYHQYAVRSMAKILRKTVRKKKNIRSRLLSLALFLICLLFALPIDGRKIEVNGNTLICWVALLMILLSVVLEDAMNGFVARRRLRPGTLENTATFQQDGYNIKNAAGVTYWKYGNVSYLAETSDYFAFVFSENQAQIFDKSELVGGSEEEFRRFIKEKSGMDWIKV